jgi:hypothetical protein
MGGAGAAGGGVPPACQGGAEQPAADDLGHFLAVSEWGEVAVPARRTRAVVGPGHCHGRRRLAAQTFIRWSRLGVWERMLAMAQARGVELGMAFLDGTSKRRD